MGERRIRMSIVLWRREAAFRVKTWQRRVAAMMARDWRTPSTPYTTRYLFLTASTVLASGSLLHADSQMFAPTENPWKAT